MVATRASTVVDTFTDVCVAINSHSHSNIGKFDVFQKEISRSIFSQHFPLILIAVITDGQRFDIQTRRNGQSGIVFHLTYKRGERVNLALYLAH